MQGIDINDVVKQIQRSGPELNQTNNTFRKLVATVGQLSSKTLEVPDEELYFILGMLTSCSVALAARHGWNALEAASSALEKMGCYSQPSSNQAFNSVMKYHSINNIDTPSGSHTYCQLHESVPPRFSRISVARTEGNQQESNQEVILSPRTARSFFTHLDGLAMLTKQEYDRRGGAVRWVVVSDEGNVIELKPGGANIPVLYEDLPLYFRLAEPYRHGPMTRNHSLVNGSMPQQDNHPKQHFKTITTKKAVPINKPAGYDAEAELSLFSPAHHTMGLFSPANPSQDYVEVPYTYTVPVTPVPDMKQVSDNGVDTFNHPPSAAVKPVVNEDIARREQFFRNVERIVDGDMSDDELSALCLTFAVPSGTGDMIPLIKNGQLIRVTNQNAVFFISRLRATGQYPEKSISPSSNSGTVTSVNGVTTIRVGDPYHGALDNFSPMHFSNDLFAPKDTTAGSIRFESSDRQEVIPEALRKSVSLMPNWEQFVRNATDDSFFTMISQEGKDGELDGLTYCMPTCLVGNKVREHLTKRQLEDPVLDLVPQGRTIAVSDIQDYRDRVAEAAEV